MRTFYLLRSFWKPILLLILMVFFNQAAATIFGTFAAVIIGIWCMTFIPMFSFLNGISRRFIGMACMSAILFFVNDWVGSKLPSFLTGRPSPQVAATPGQPTPPIPSYAVMDGIHDPVPSVGIPDRIQARADTIQPLRDRPGMLTLLALIGGAGVGYASLSFWRARASAVVRIPARIHPSVVPALRRAGRYDGYAASWGDQAVDDPRPGGAVDPPGVLRSALGKPYRRDEHGAVVLLTEDEVAAMRAASGLPAVVVEAPPQRITALGVPLGPVAAAPVAQETRIATLPGKAQIAALRCRKTGIPATALRDEDVIIVSVNDIEVVRGTPRIAEVLA